MRVIRPAQPKPAPLSLNIYSSSATEHSTLSYPKSPCYMNEMQMGPSNFRSCSNHQQLANFTTNSNMQTSGCMQFNFTIESCTSPEQQTQAQVILPNTLVIPSGEHLSAVQETMPDFTCFDVPATVWPSGYPRLFPPITTPTHLDFSPPDSPTLFAHTPSYEEMLVESVKYLQAVSESQRKCFQGAYISDIIAQIAKKHGHELPARYRESLSVSLKRAFKKGIFIRTFGGVYALNYEYKGPIARGRRKIVVN